ncbi:MAG: hypothetical protein JW863_12330 [Chitinispirillaceae bacterium]|nr:hypothetical protein [Chitinispirillaceae bacterium]
MNCRIHLLLILLLFGMNASAAMLPRRGTFLFDSDFSGAIVWDGFGLQEKEIAELFGFGITVDSSGTIVESGGLRYFHIEFGPAGAVAMYLSRFLAIGGGYRYGWVSQFIRTNHRVENNPGGRRLLSWHQIRGQLIGSVPLANGDGIDIIGIPFYTFGTITRVPLAVKIYEDVTTAEVQDLIEELHEPVDYRGYGFELRIRGRHFITDHFYLHGSFQGNVQKTWTEDDLMEEFVGNAPQGSFGVLLGMGLMFGGTVKVSGSSKASSFRDLFNK